MDRDTAARVLGVPADASAARVRRAYRARARITHPDRFPPGSEAWEEASLAMQSLNEARHALGGPVEPPPAGATPRPAAPSTYAGVPSHGSDGFRSARDTDRLARAWGYSWGGFLVAAAVVSWLVGSAAPVNDAVPLWSPGLAVIGLVSLVIGRRADRRIRGSAAEGPGRQE
jgi:hypothetical protein